MVDDRLAQPLTRSRAEPALQVRVGDGTVQEAQGAGVEQLATGALREVNAVRARLPPRLTRCTPSEKSVGASMTFAVSPATTLSGAGISAASRRMLSSSFTPGTKMQSAPAWT